MSFEPIAGNPDLLTIRANSLVTTANTIRDAARDLRNVASEIRTISLAVDEVREKAGEVAEVIVHAETRYRGTGEALQTYAVTLRDVQSRANTAITNADDAIGYRLTAERMREQYRWEALGGGPDADEALRQFNYWHDRVQHHDQSIANARTTYEQAERDLEAAAQTAINAIDTAMDNSGLNDGWLDHLRSFWENVIVPGLRFIQDVLDAIAPYLAALTLIFTVLAVFFPVFGVIAAALKLLSLLHAGLSFATTVGLAVAGERSLGDVLAAGLNVGFALLAGPIKAFQGATGPLSFAANSGRGGIQALTTNFKTVFSSANWRDLGSQLITRNIQTSTGIAGTNALRSLLGGAANEALSSSTKQVIINSAGIEVIKTGLTGVMDWQIKNIGIRDPLKWVVGHV